jgi:hypothetical protein
MLEQYFWETIFHWYREQHTLIKELILLESILRMTSQSKYLSYQTTMMLTSSQENTTEDLYVKHANNMVEDLEVM